MEGFISIHRKIFNNWVWDDKPFSRGQAWVDILLMANHKDNKFPLGKEIVSIERGSFITSELKLMERWGWGKSKTRTFLKLLEDDKMIIKKSNNKQTTIKVCNYNDYQLSSNHKQTTDEPQTNHKQTTDEPQTYTNNNDNNVNKVNNDNKKESSRFTPPTHEEVRNYCLERNNNVDTDQFINFYEAKGWMVGKNKMKDWKAAIRTWEKRAHINKKEDDRKENTNEYKYVEPKPSIDEDKFYSNEYVENLPF